MVTRDAASRHGWVHCKRRRRDPARRRRWRSSGWHGPSQTRCWATTATSRQRDQRQPGVTGCAGLSPARAAASSTDGNQASQCGDDGGGQHHQTPSSAYTPYWRAAAWSSFHNVDQISTRYNRMCVQCHHGALRRRQHLAMGSSQPAAETISRGGYATGEARSSCSKAGGCRIMRACVLLPAGLAAELIAAVLLLRCAGRRQRGVGLLPSARAGFQRERHAAGGDRHALLRRRAVQNPGPGGRGPRPGAPRHALWARQRGLSAQRPGQQTESGGWSGCRPSIRRCQAAPTDYRTGAARNRCWLARDDFWPLAAALQAAPLDLRIHQSQACGVRPNWPETVLMPISVFVTAGCRTGYCASVFHAPGSEVEGAGVENQPASLPSRPIPNAARWCGGRFCAGADWRQNVGAERRDAGTGRHAYTTPRPTELDYDEAAPDAAA